MFGCLVTVILCCVLHRPSAFLLLLNRVWIAPAVSFAFLLPTQPWQMTGPVNVNWAEDQLWCLRQGGCPLKGHVQEFIGLSYLVSWLDASLCACFQLGLHENTIRCHFPFCDFSVVELINLILYLNGSNFEVKEIQAKSHSRPTPFENYWASPAHPRPVSTTYLALITLILLCLPVPEGGHPRALGCTWEPKWRIQLSVHSALHAASLHPSPTPKSLPVLGTKIQAVPQSGLPVTPQSGPLSAPFPSPRMTAAISFTSTQRRITRRKRLLALAPAQSREMALAPSQSQERAPVPKFDPEKTPVPELG